MRPRRAARLREDEDTLSARVDRWRALLTRRRAPLGLAIAAVALASPSLAVGQQLDDLWQRWVMSGRVPGRSPWDMFAFVDGDAAHTQALRDLGFMPWWTWDGTRLRFWRPLSVLTHWIDAHAWPDAPVLMHAQSLLWFGALVALVALLYRRLLGPTLAAGLAALLFALDDAHGIPAGWLANRNALVAAVPGIVAILAHDRWRREGWRAGALLGPLAFAASLAGGEAALGALAYLLAHAIALDRGRTSQRIAAMAPYVLLLVAWRIAYRHLGYGAHGSALYIDPMRDPADYAVALCARLPLQLALQMVPWPADVYTFVPEGARTVAVIASTGVVGVAGVLLAPLLRRDACARFFALGAVAATLPTAATFPSDRTLAFVGVGVLGLAGQLVAGVWEAASRPRAGVRLASGAIVVIHLVVAPLLLPLRAYTPRILGDLMNRAVDTAPADEALTRQDLVVVAEPEPYGGGWLAVVRPFAPAPQPPIPLHARRLASNLVPLVVQRADARTLVIRAESGSLAGFDGAMVRDPKHPFAPGEVVRLTGLDIVVTAVADDGHARVARYVFERDLEHASLRWMIWRSGALVPWTPPAVGASVTLPVETLKIL